MKVQHSALTTHLYKYHPLEKTEPRVILSAEREESLRSSRGHTAWGFFTSFRMTGCLQFGPPHQHLLREAIYEMGSQLLQGGSWPPSSARGSSSFTATPLVDSRIIWAASLMILWAAAAVATPRE